MRTKVRSQLVFNYLFMLFVVVIVFFLFFVLTDFSNHMLAGNLVKDRYPAQTVAESSLDPMLIEEIAAHNGAVYFVDQSLRGVHLGGIHPFEFGQFDNSSFTKFLIDSKRSGTPYSINTYYSEDLEGWVFVVFPTSLRIEFGIVVNRLFSSVDRQKVESVVFFLAIMVVLLLSLGVFALSKFSSLQFLKPINAMKEALTHVKKGDYSHRVNLKASREFEEVAGLFNEMTSEIQRKDEALKEAEHQRQQLILDISHDLRNPLAVMLGFSEILGQDMIEEDQRRKFASTIHHHGLRAKNLIDQLFELSTIESGRFALDKKELDFYEYLRKVVANHIPIFEKEGFNYAVDIPEEPILLKFDPRWMDRALNNMLENVVKHNKAGTTITIKAYIENKTCFFVISDESQGLDPSLQTAIFDRFVTADPTSGTTGLGLSIVKKIIAEHGGTVVCESKIGEGCRFVVGLPI